MDHSKIAPGLRWRIGTAIPLLVVVVAFYFVLMGLRPTALYWGGIKVSKPINPEKLFRDDNQLVFETTQVVPVRAGIEGTVSVFDDLVEIRNGPQSSSAQEGTILQYQGGLRLDKTSSGQRVDRGQVIGSLVPSASNPLVATLRLELLRDGKVVPPPANVPPLYSSAGQRTYATHCGGCHEQHGVVPLHNGKMKDGQPATKEVVRERILEGGRGMPSFRGVLTPEELDNVLEFFCASRCTGQTTPRQAATALPYKLLQ